MKFRTFNNKSLPSLTPAAFLVALTHAQLGYADQSDHLAQTVSETELSANQSIPDADDNSVTVEGVEIQGDYPQQDIDQPIDLETMVISAEPMDVPAQSTYSTRSEIGNASDGADMLKQIPGISLIRQGGTASDPVLRGLGGTRLNVLIDGVPFGGACNHRMDPPTAYVKPGTFKTVTLLQGPQSVKNGNSIAGAINFERIPEPFTDWGLRSYVSGLWGSFNQQDYSADITGGFEYGFLNYTGNRSKSDNYVDGNGDEVNLTFYDTWNDRVLLGITPNEDTLVEFSALHSDGTIANATIHMDVTDLDRENYRFHVDSNNITTWLKNIDFIFDHTKVKHTMDNYSLRELKPFHEYILMGQNWQQYFGKLEGTFEVDPDIELITGFSYREDSYQADADGNFFFISQPSLDDFRPIVDFYNFAGYMELSYIQTDDLRWVSGFRGDSYTTDTHTMRAAGEVSPLILSGSNKKRTQNLFSGFFRAEYQLPDYPVMLMAGYGHSERGADYWEVYSMDGFDLKKEKNNEIDAKMIYTGEKLTGEFALFYSRIDDFILVHRGDSASNIDAERVGGELNLTYELLDNLLLTGNLAYVYAKNLTQDTPLAQTPPLDGTLGINYTYGPFFGQFKTRFVDRQDRIHKGYGNTLALDTTPTGGFIVSSLQLGYNYKEIVDVKFGIDNLFDKTYTEHLNRSGGGIGVTRVSKINEPGRVFWGRVTIDFDI